ncbi:MAG: 6-phosphofructokinase [Gammaproteobacteria bacterium]|nr:6-phosphofructokinase [Gammaproteobacteria bacterium]
MTKHIGILTSGGDCPGLNAAIRGVGKTAQDNFNMKVTGFQDGFRGLMENRTVQLDSQALSGILTIGGTILGTSRDKPHRMNVDGTVQDMTNIIVQNYHANHLDALVCLGGGGTQKNALRLKQQGLNIITLPKTIDNDVAKTDITFGFHTAMDIATSAIDRLHSTAHSHHRIVLVEIMGHRAGWLTLGSGIAGGADVILIPEIPYEINSVADAIKKRVKKGKQFSIIAIAEGALSIQTNTEKQQLEMKKQKATTKADKKQINKKLKTLDEQRTDRTFLIAKQLEEITGLESRVTILGHLQRGGTPSASDRLLATRLGSACVQFINDENFGIMVATRGNNIDAVPIETVAGQRKLVPKNHSWIVSARCLGTNFGD